jgi:hypothetical protein
LRGWTKNTSDQYKKEKKEILDTLDGLYKKAEHTLLQIEEINIKQCLNNSLSHLLHEKEIKWYQRAKVKDLLKSDYNAKYFQLVVSRKYRKQEYFSCNMRIG